MGCWGFLFWFVVDSKSHRKLVPSIFRVILDRTSAEYDQILKPLDPEVFTSSPDSAASHLDPSTWTNASRTLPGQAGSLAEILSNIKACRLRCFRPRSTQHKDSSRTKVSLNESSRASGASPTALSTTRKGASGRQLMALSVVAEVFTMYCRMGSYFTWKWACCSAGPSAVLNVRSCSTYSPDSCVL